MEIVESCPVCANVKFVSRFECKDWLVSGETFTVMSCANCGLHFTNPRPHKEDISQYYDSKNYVSHHDEATGLINTLYKYVRNYTIKKKVAFLFQLNKNKPGKLLDIGCGSGVFIEAAAKKEWSVLGVEPDESARFLVQEKGITAKPVEYLSDLKPNTFDIITLWHVLEHTYSPDKMLSICEKALKKEGAVIIAVPNRSSFDAKYYKENWAAYDVPRHLFHFTKKNIFQLAENAGLKVCTFKPMLFDSYYVSLISEKHQKGNMLSAFIVGAFSNLVGIFKKEYSSHLYILRKEKE